MKQLEKYNPANEQLVYCNPHNNRQTIVEIWAEPIGRYTIRAGKNSDYSYTGLCPNTTTIEQVKAAINKLYVNNELFK